MGEAVTPALPPGFVIDAKAPPLPAGFVLDGAAPEQSFPQKLGRAVLDKAGGLVAGAADIDGNTVVLSAGHNVVATASGDPFADAPVNAEFEKQFGKANIDRIRNFK